MVKSNSKEERCIFNKWCWNNKNIYVQKGKGKERGEETQGRKKKGEER